MPLTDLDQIVRSLEARRRADRILCLDARHAEIIDVWFPLLGLPETRRHAPAPGFWQATATWPADRLIWRDESAEAEYIRRYEEGIVEACKEADQGEEFVWNLDKEAEEKGWRVPWSWSHGVFVDHAGEILAEGMEQHILGPIDLVAYALFYDETDETPDFDAARAWLTKIVRSSAVGGASRWRQTDITAAIEEPRQNRRRQTCGSCKHAIRPLDMEDAANSASVVMGFCRPEETIHCLFESMPSANQYLPQDSKMPCWEPRPTC